MVPPTWDLDLGLGPWDHGLGPSLATKQAPISGRLDPNHTKTAVLLDHGVPAMGAVRPRDGDAAEGTEQWDEEDLHNAAKEEEGIGSRGIGFRLANEKPGIGIGGKAPLGLGSNLWVGPGRRGHQATTQRRKEEEGSY